MAGFIYYLPGLNSTDLKTGAGKIDHAHLAGLPLADVTDWPRDAVVADCPAGPDRSSGVTVYPIRPAGVGGEAIEYSPTTQRWEQIHGVWIGWTTTAAPGPDDLQRRRLIPGYMLPDEFERRWQIPLARTPSDPLGQLERDVDFDIAGEPHEVIKAKHRELWELAGEYWDWRNFEDWKTHKEVGSTPPGERPADRVELPAERDLAWVYKLALRVLATNYRIGPVELAALRMAGAGLLDKSLAIGVCDFLIGNELVMRYEAKKKPVDTKPTAAVSSSTPGAPDAEHRTAPATAS